jgi:hypothetical protein
LVAWKPCVSYDESEPLLPFLFCPSSRASPKPLVRLSLSSVTFFK